MLPPSRMAARSEPAGPLATATIPFGSAAPVATDSMIAHKLFSSVCWCQPLPEGEMHCELHSSDPRVIEAARRVFGSARRGRAATNKSGCSLRFVVEPGHNAASDTSAGWQVGIEGGDVICVSHSPEHAVAAVEYAAVGVVACQTTCVSLHAALLARRGRGVLLIGGNGSGKTTLACALWQQGWELLCDDCVLLGQAGTVVPALRRVSLRATSRVLLGEPLWERASKTPSHLSTAAGMLFHPHDLRPLSLPDKLVVGAMLFLGRGGHSGPPATLRALNAALTLLHLLPYSPLLKIAGQVVAMDRLAPLAEHAASYDLMRGPLPCMVAAVDDLMSRFEEGPAHAG